MSIDDRKLHSIIIRNSYPLPRKEAREQLLVVPPDVGLPSS